MNKEEHPWSICFTLLGDSTVIVEFGTSIQADIHEKLKELVHFIETKPSEGIIESVPSYTSVTVYYNPVSFSSQPYALVCEQLKKAIEKLCLSHVATSRTVEIPVRYGGEFGPDLAYAASLTD
jgi:inhibitor of KinA